VLRALVPLVLAVMAERKPAEVLAVHDGIDMATAESMASVGRKRP